MNRKAMDVWVGIFVAIGVLSLLFLAFRVANLTTASSAQTYALVAEFDNIGGLKVKAPVKSAGVVVGRVTAITLSRETYRARATLAMDSRYQFSRDTSAEILTAGLLGEQYIGITQGGDEDNLKAGDKIKVTNGYVNEFQGEMQLTAGKFGKLEVVKN